MEPFVFLIEVNNIVNGHLEIFSNLDKAIYRYFLLVVLYFGVTRLLGMNQISHSLLRVILILSQFF